MSLHQIKIKITKRVPFPAFTMGRRWGYDIKKHQDWVGARGKVCFPAR